MSLVAAARHNIKWVEILIKYLRGKGDNTTVIILHTVSVHKWYGCKGKFEKSRYWLHYMPAQQTQNICITFMQRRPNVFDVGPTLYTCYTNVLCFLGGHLSYFLCYYICHNGGRDISLDMTFGWFEIWPLVTLRTYRMRCIVLLPVTISHVILNDQVVEVSWPTNPSTIHMND